MAGAGLAWDVEALQRRLDARCPGIAVEVVAETGSTNSDLLEVMRDVDAAAAVPPGRSDAAARFRPRLRVAEQQTSGRGRHGRVWSSRRGASLTFSLALPLRRADLSGLSLAVGVAIAEALDSAATPRPAIASASIALKWPNDLWLVERRGNGRKLGGVLIEMVGHGAGRVAVIGVGLNVRSMAADAEEAPDAASLDEIEPRANVVSTLEAIAAPLVEAVVAFEADGFAAFHARYAARDALAGLAVRTTDPAVDEGVAAGVTGHGALLVRRADGTLHAVSSGEVSVRLQPAETASRC